MIGAFIGFMVLIYMIKTEFMQLNHWNISDQFCWPGTWHQFLIRNLKQHSIPCNNRNWYIQGYH